MPSTKQWTIQLMFAGLLMLGIDNGFAGQQKWSSQYVFWKPFSNVKEVFNIDQDIWIPQPNAKSYWTLQYGFTGGVGAYMGLQQGKSAKEQNVRFSIWDALGARGDHCRTFGGEGIGYTCVQSIKIDPRKFYRLRVWRLDKDTDGQWWGGYLLEFNQNGQVKEHFIGQIKAKPGAVFIKPNSISNFVEYWGESFDHCNKVPLSVAVFMPPSVNYNGKETGTYQGYSSFKGSKKASGNLCVTGAEAKGAFITASPITINNKQGAMMFLGGVVNQHQLNHQLHPTPALTPVK